MDRQMSTCFSDGGFYKIELLTEDMSYVRTTCFFVSDKIPDNTYNDWSSFNRHNFKLIKDSEVGIKLDKIFVRKINPTDAYGYADGVNSDTLLLALESFCGEVVFYK